MIRMEIACFLVIAFMAVMYFTAKREKTRLHRIFSAVLILSMIHLILDGVTIYTVNHLDSIPIWANTVIHRLFLGTMDVIFYLVYYYIVALAEDESGDCRRITGFGKLMLGIVLICVLFLPIHYVETDRGNYSYGPTVYMVYACIGIYLLLTIITLCRHWTQIHRKKKVAVSIAFNNRGRDIAISDAASVGISQRNGDYVNQSVLLYDYGKSGYFSGTAGTGGKT